MDAWPLCGLAIVALGCGPSVESSPGVLLQRWTVGGELVRSDTDVWIHSGGCRVHRIGSTTGELETITAPDGCSEIRIFDDRLAFELQDGAWQVAESPGHPALELHGGEVMVAVDRVLHRVDTRLSDPLRYWTLPVAGRIEATLSGQTPYLHTSGSAPDQVSVTTLIDHPASGLRVRWFYLENGSVESETTLEVPPGARLAAFDHDTVVLVQSERTVRAEHRVRVSDPTNQHVRVVRNEPASWTFQSRSPVVAVDMSLHFTFVDSLVEPGLHEVYALDPATGATRWTQRVRAVQLRLFPDDQQVVWARDRVVARIDRDTGRELWTWPLLGTPRSVQRMYDNVWLASGPLMGTEMFRIDPP
jgi:hypothetical protein